MTSDERVELQTLIDAARRRAAMTSPSHRVWETIQDAEGLLRGLGSVTSFETLRCELGAMARTRENE